MCEVRGGTTKATATATTTATRIYTRCCCFSCCCFCRSCCVCWCLYCWFCCCRDCGGAYQDDRHAVLLRHRTHVEGARNGASDRSLEIGVVEALAGIELGAARRELNDDRRVQLARRLQARVDRRRGHAVDGRDGVALRFGIVQQINESIASHDTGVDGVGQVRVRAERALANAWNAPARKRIAHGVRKQSRGGALAGGSSISSVPPAMHLAHCLKHEGMR